MFGEFESTDALVGGQPLAQVRKDVGGELGRRAVVRFERHEALRHRKTQGIGARDDRRLCDRRMLDNDRLQFERRDPVVRRS